MHKYLKPIIKNISLSIILLTGLYLLGAFFILKNNWSSSAYFIVNILIHCIIGAVFAMIYRNNLHFYFIIPIVLFDFALLLIYREIHFYFFTLPMSAIAIYYMTGMLQKIRTSTKKNNIKQIRRKYERLHKK